MKKLSCIGLFAVALLLVGGTGCAELIVVHPSATSDLLPNPYKGYAPYADTFYADPSIPQSLVYDDVTWKALEPDMPGVIDWNALEDDWTQHTALGRRIGFRFKCADPWSGDLTDIPDWLVSAGVATFPYSIDGGSGTLPDWDDPVFLGQHDRIIAALGDRYNNDPRIAWIDVGSYGIWGEWHVYQNEHLAASQATKQRILDAYLAAFPDKQLVIPFDDDFAMVYMAERGYGIRNDCLGTADSNDWFDESMDALDIDIDALAATGMVTGEFCGSEQGAREGFSQRFDLNLDFIVRNHWSFIGPAGGSLLAASGTLLDNARTAYKRMGYRFRIHEARWNDPASAALSLAITMVNEGSAPLYYPWPVHIALAQSGNLAADVEMTEARWDCRTWLPRETVMTANISLSVPPGTYDILFYMLDPATGQPGIRLANTGHDGNTRYKLGTVTIIAGEYAGGDLDKDGDVDGIDLWQMQSAFDSEAGEENFNPAADMDFNMKINETDLVHLLSDYGK
ncbi:DUF4832 domain-containing protein [Desulfosarcina variabilis]|uniref:DUF4832 domain-containing protein n=1 Tax=Desulfosarcina variabilis TaxID=2300 RepID=UPI003AFA5E77